MLLFSLFVFLLWFLLCCFDVFALFLLCLLCLALAFILEQFLPGALCFFLVLLFFCTLFICKNHVLLCVCSLTCFGFSCTRSGLPLPFLSLYFFCVFLLGLKDPYFCPVCPPVNIATIDISCFAVSFLCILHVRCGRMLLHNADLCPSDPNPRDPPCP